MPRVSRIIKDEGVFHVMFRGNNKQWRFHDDEDFHWKPKKTNIFP